MMFSETLRGAFLDHKNIDHTLLVRGDDRFSYADVIERGSIIAFILRDRGIGVGDRVVIDLGNTTETVLSVVGCILNGSTFIPVDPASSAERLHYIIGDSGASCVITKRSISNDVSTKLSPDKFKNYISSGIPEDVSVAPEDLAAIIYTSGSTGVPKGVMLTNRNMTFAARSIITYLRNKPGDVILSCLPLSFDYGLYQLLMSMIFGGTLVLESSFTYPGRIISLLEKEKVTGFPIVASMGAILLKRFDLSSRDLGALRYITNTAQPLPAWVSKGLRESLPHVQIYSMYGLTECKRTTFLDPSKIDEKPDSVGKAIPGTEVLLVDESGARIEKPFTEGELIVKGPHIMRGYLNDPGLTSKIIRTHEGERALFTGDLFHFDEVGDLYFRGRRDDLIKVNGEKVYPVEIERLLESFHGIQEAAVVGINHDIKGSSLVAFFVGEPEIDENELRTWLKNRLEAYKVPDRFVRSEVIPRTSNGKKDKKKLLSLLINH